MKYIDTVRETSRVYRKLLQHTKGHRRMYLLSQCLAISMDIAYSVVIALAFQNLIDQTAASGVIHWSSVAVYLVAVMLVVVTWGFGDSYISARLQDQWQIYYRSAMFDRLIAADISASLQLDLGAVAKRYSVDVKNTAQFLVRRISSSILSPLIGGIGCLVLLIFIHPVLALLVLVVGIFVFYLQKAPVPKADKYASEQQQAESDYSASMYDMMNNLPVIRVFGAIRFLRSRIRRDAERIYSTGVNTLKVELYQKLLLVLGQFLQTVVLAIAGAYFIERGEITLGELFAAITYAESVGFMFDGVSRGLANVQGGRASGVRVLEILEMPAASCEIASVVETDKALEVEKLSYSVGGHKLLNSVSFSIGIGEKAAIMGQSGSGKTTLAHIISGLISSCEGKILLHSQKLCYVPAAANLLQATVLDNITCFEKEPDMDKVRRIVEGLDLNIDTLKSSIEAHGENVSGGQRQRILIARALYSENDIYLFDEPTAALDAESSEKVMNIILDILKEKTVLIITHDDYVASRMDRRFDLKQGKLTAKT